MSVDYNDPYAARYGQQYHQQGPYGPSYEPPQRYDQEETFAAYPTEKTPQNLRKWRYDHQMASWTSGGRGRCVGRFCCCTVMIFLFLLISILLSLALWARPPNISILNVEPPQTGSAIQIQNDGVSINLGVDISVTNPNYFSVAFSKIQADIFYPINNIPIGGGRQNNVVFKAHETTNFTFPFSIKYQPSKDPGHLILADLWKKCGFAGNTKSDIQVRYEFTPGVRVLFLTISPVIKNSFGFPCPLSESDLEAVLAQAGVKLSDLLGRDHYQLG